MSRNITSIGQGKGNTKHEHHCLNHNFCTRCPRKRLLFGWMLFLINSHIRSEISVLTYHIPFLSNMTSYMTCFCKMVYFGLIITKFGTVVYWVPQRSQNTCCSDWGHNDVDVMAVLWIHYMNMKIC